MIRSSSLGAAALLAALIAVAPAEAQPAKAATTADQARTLYVEGKELRRAGDLQASLEKLEAAHALYATPITALEVGRGAALLGRLRRAVEVLESIDRLPVKPGESAKAAAARAEAAALLAQYRTRLGRITVRVEGEGARVRIDGDAVAGEALAAPWLVDAGAHHVEAERGGERVTEDVRVGEGEERVVTLRFPAPVAPPPAPSPAPVTQPPAPLTPPPAAVTPPAAPAPRAGRRFGPLAYVGFGVAGLGLTAGAITGAVTLARAPSLKRECPGGACPASSNVETTKALGNASTASFIIGGAGLAVGIGALLLSGDRPPPRSMSIGPWMGGSMAGLRGAF
jgi:hypothetical protein